MSTISIVRDWGVITDATLSIQAASGVVSSVTGTPAANQFLVDKPRNGVLYRALTVALAGARGGHLYQNKSSLGPKPKITTAGLMSLAVGGWVMFHRFGSAYGEGFGAAMVSGNALECWASRIYVSIDSAAFIGSVNHKCGYWAFEGLTVPPQPVGGLARVGRNLLASRMNGTDIYVYHAHAGTLILGQTLTAPVSVRRMAYDGKYLWLTNATNLYQCAIHQ